MATPALQSEYIVRALEADIAANFRNRLDEVEAAWALEGVPLTLPSPVAVTRGFIESLQTMASSDFPRISILGAPVAPVLNDDQDRIQDAIHTIVLEWHVLGTSPDLAVTHMWRYGQALMSLIRAAGGYSGFRLRGLVPTISEGQPMPHRGPVGSVNENLWLAGSIATMPLRGRYTS